MFLAEPPPTQGDIHFRIAGTPVRIHPFFWLSTLLLGLSGGGSTPPAELLIWIVAVVSSILIHELGHCVAQRFYGGHPRIILHGFGGLAICNDCDRSTKSQILISLAGPVAGFLFAALMLVVIRASGHRTGVEWGSNISLEALGLERARVMSILGMSFYWAPFGSEWIDNLIGNLLWINGLWGAVNLLPIYPLDGGHIARELCMLGQPRQGLILSLKISIIAAGAMALVGLSWRSLFVGLFFAYLAYSSYRTIEAYRANQW